MPKPLELVATCALGLEELLEGELRDLGIDGPARLRGAVGFRGDWTDVWRGSRERGSYWFWPNVWGTECDNVHSAPEFPAFVKEVGLDEYWSRVGWPKWCRPQGESFACGRNMSGD